MTGQLPVGSPPRGHWRWNAHGSRALVAYLCTICKVLGIKILNCMERLLVCQGAEVRFIGPLTCDSEEGAREPPSRRRAKQEARSAVSRLHVPECADVPPYIHMSACQPPVALDWPSRHSTTPPCSQSPESLQGHDGIRVRRPFSLFIFFCPVK